MARAPSQKAIAEAIQADNAKRAKRGQDKRQATRDRKAAEKLLLTQALEAKQAAKATDAEAEQAGYIAALKIDAKAVWFETLTEVEQEEVNNGERECPDEFITEYVAKELDLPADAPARKQRERTYFGPMLALRDAAKRYTKAPNGILNNGDRLATFLGSFTREQVVAGLVKALIEAKLEAGNRYAAMNPGQQSMNLRNRCRHQLAAGTITMAQIEAAFADQKKVA